jgi:3D (Asp-Asp-Asp) domain-containing protein
MKYIIVLAMIVLSIHFYQKEQEEQMQQDLDRFQIQVEHAEYKTIKSELKLIKQANVIATRGTTEIRLKNLGTFTITAYTSGFESTGKNIGDKGYGITASGEEVKEYHTIASDWSVLPKGSKVLIGDNPTIYTVTDKGGTIKGNKLDIYIADLNEALNFGKKELTVYLIE